MRRGNAGVGRRGGGFRGIGSAASFTPANYPGLGALAWWSPTRGYDATTVSTWLDQIGSYAFTAAGAARPTQSSTAFTDQYGLTHPGMVLSGAQAMSCSAAGLKAAHGAVQSCTLIMALQKPNTGTYVLIEWSPDQSVVNGAWGVFGNNVNSYSIEPNIHSAGGNGIWRSLAAEAPFADPGVMSFNFGVSAVGTSIQSLDGVQMRGTAIASAYGTGNLCASSTLYLGGRAASSLFTTGSVGDIIIAGPNATAAALQWARAYVGANIGATTA